MKKAKTNKKKLGWFLSIFNFIFKWYYKAWKPKVQMRDGLYPTTFRQDQLVARGYAMLQAQGKSKREARRIIGKKLGIKIIPEGK